MQWNDWSDEAFASARERGRPVLLFLQASWCRWCRELERRSLSDPRAQRLIDDHFVAIRVDKDRRPDLDARYSKGGWPTLSWLDDSGELITSDAYLEPDELVERLQLIAGYWAENREVIRRRLSEAAEAVARGGPRGAVPHGGPVQPPPPKRDSDREIVDWVARTLLESADPQWGGWGREHKFPHPEAIDFALIRWSQSGDEAMRRLVLRTLRNMQQGEIHDRVEGGFYRFENWPDWSAPQFEKVLDSNAKRLYS